MKELVALSIFLGFAVFGAYLVKKESKKSGIISILTFAIVSGFVIANYDVITNFKGGGLELEIAKKEIQSEGNEAVERIKAEAKAQKESIELLTANTNDARKRLDNQKSDVQELLGKIEKQRAYLQTLNTQAEQTKEAIEKARDEILQLAEEVKIQKGGLESIVSKAEQTKKEIETAVNEILRLDVSSKELMLAWIKVVWLRMSTKNEFGSGQRLKIAHKEILNELDRSLVLAIPDPTERAAWLVKLTQLLPSLR